ncbi:hypothetical protein PSTG_07863 [Puccinia striiformis f. sp. tritici PST-78]|uniref:Uncharacterized protein n=1 Tax=Puccinia striiformis f. sp. tritici PST-78 TaxID=1165861 RepID=A0A0L0VHZ5_9BASI|nr:hypothetical protein PSTG_07863 [Puccinia striiformis f. sp. tritici PST-78]
MSRTRSSGNSLLPLANPEALLRKAAAEQRRLAKILANSTESSIPVPSTSFHTPATSSPGTPAKPPFTPSLLRTKSLADSTILNSADPPPNDLDPTKSSEPSKTTDPPKTAAPVSSKGGAPASSKTNSTTAGAEHYIELLAKLQHAEAVQHQEERRQLQEERRLNLAERQANQERIACLENTLFNIVIKSEEEKRKRMSPAKKTNRLDLQSSVSPRDRHTLTKNIPDDDNKIYVAGGLIRDTNLVGFYASEGQSFIGKTWDVFKARIFKVALPQRWRTDLKSKLRKLLMGPTELFIVFSGRARTLQTLINFNDAATTSPAPTQISDFDLAEFVILGITEELNAEVANQRASRASNTNHAPSNSPPDPVAWRVHAYLDLQGQCHHCKTTCGSAVGACIKPLNKRWVDIPDSFQTRRQPADYKPPQALGSTTLGAGKATHPAAGRPPFQAASLAAVSESVNDG